MSEDLIGAGTGTGDDPALGVPGAPLARVAAVLGATVVGAGRGAGAVTVGGVIIAEPGDALGDLTGVLVLTAGVRGADAADQVGAAAGAGAAAVAVRVDTTGVPVAADEVPAAVRQCAERAGVPVLAVAAGLRWDQVETAVRGELARAAAAERGGGPRGDLYALAQTVASLTRGLVSVEDTGHRVLAYAGSADEADEPRRRSILERACAEPCLSHMREWGVYRRVRDGDEVVDVAARPELGLRRRLVVGIHAGPRPLGTLWLQEGDRPLADRSDQVLRGAARLAAPQLVDHYYLGDPDGRLRSREDLAHGLLTGRFNASALAVHLGIAPTSGASVVAVDLREEPDAGDAARRDARLAEAAGMVSVHAAAYRRNALVAQACGQIYVMLPEPADRAPAERPLLRWTNDLVTVLRGHTRTPVQAVVAGTAADLADIPVVKLRGHHGLEILARTPHRAVETHDRLVSPLMVREVLDVLDRHGGVRHPGLEALAAHDAAHGTELARSLLRYLDAFGEVGVVAKELSVHPNTLRYRVRKAVALAGLDLDDPEHRLAAMLGLRLMNRGSGAENGAPFFPH
ncbi:helix-turn-helix domain-containing protein [Streptomyces sp. NPDC008150]|uniref:helix-turn-helix domain-containing protein n=1 Tax=Streptomyces sp. NPDC008150 TaxID=3364816 RepID=UPI0036ECA87D